MWGTGGPTGLGEPVSYPVKVSTNQSKFTAIQLHLNESSLWLYWKHIQILMYRHLWNAITNCIYNYNKQQQWWTAETCLRITERTSADAVHETSCGSKCATLAGWYWYNSAADWRYFTAAASIFCTRETRETTLSNNGFLRSVHITHL